MAAHPTPEQDVRTITRVDDRPAGDAVAPPGNAGPDCFWLPGDLQLPSPRIAEVHLLDQQAKPPRPYPAT